MQDKTCTQITGTLNRSIPIFYKQTNWLDCFDRLQLGQLKTRIYYIDINKLRRENTKNIHLTKSEIMKFKYFCVSITLLTLNPFLISIRR